MVAVRPLDCAFHNSFGMPTLAKPAFHKAQGEDMNSTWRKRTTSKTNGRCVEVARSPGDPSGVCARSIGWLP